MRTRTIAHVPDSALEVETGNGSISVQRGTGPSVEIVAHIRAGSMQRLLQVEVVSERAEDGTLVVGARWPEKVRTHEGCSFEIRVPDSHGVTLSASNGKLRVEGLSGPADLQSENGGIEIIDHSGAARVALSNGRVKLGGVRGPVVVETANAAIGMQDVAGPVAARSANGVIRVALARDNPGPIDIATRNGTIDLSLGPAFAGRLLLSATDGMIRVDHPAITKAATRDDVELAFGGSSRRSLVRTTNGSIEVRAIREIVFAN